MKAISLRTVAFQSYAWVSKKVDDVNEYLEKNILVKWICYIAIILVVAYFIGNFIQPGVDPVPPVVGD